MFHTNKSLSRYCNRFKTAIDNLNSIESLKENIKFLESKRNDFDSGS